MLRTLFINSCVILALFRFFPHYIYGGREKPSKNKISVNVAVGIYPAAFCCPKEGEKHGAENNSVTGPQGSPVGMQTLLQLQSWQLSAAGRRRKTHLCTAYQSVRYLLQILSDCGVTSRKRIARKNINSKQI